MKTWLPAWAWKFVLLHLFSFKSRPAVRWMNGFALLGLSLGVFAWISVVSVMSGLQGDIKTKILSEKPHLIWEGRPQSQDQSLEAKLKDPTFQNEIESVQFLLQSEGLLEVPNSKNQNRISGSGVVLQGVPGLGDRLLVGAELGSTHMLTLGDEIKLRSAWKLEVPPLVKEVSGYFQSGVYEIDRSTVRVDRKVLEDWLSIPNAFSKIEIKLKNPLQADNLKNLMSEKLGLPLKSWQQTDAALWYSLKLEKIFMTLSIFFVVLLAALAVHLAISVRIAEKYREIALLEALGAEEKILSRLFLTEGLFMGFLGSFVGLVGSYFFCNYLAGSYELPDFYYSTQVPVEWNWGTNLLLALVAIILSLISSWAPAKRVSSVSIQEALRS